MLIFTKGMLFLFFKLKKEAIFAKKLFIIMKTNVLTKDWANGKDTGLLIMRFILGFLLLYGHGFGKLSTVFSGQEIQFMDPIGIGATFSFYLAALAEGICALLLILGLFSRYASIILTVNFVVILIFHGIIMGDAFNVLEVRFLYFFGFLATIFSGPGRFSLDYLLFHKK